MLKAMRENTHAKDVRVHIGTDHAGFEFSKRIVTTLSGLGYTVIDHGPTAFDAEDDYPHFCIETAEGVVTDLANGKNALGIVLGGSGNGEQMAANKVPGIRAALVWNLSIAKLARQHNDANVIAIGARQHSDREVLAFIETFLTEPFSEDPRHVRRIGQIAAYEKAR